MLPTLQPQISPVCSLNSLADTWAKYVMEELEVYDSQFLGGYLVSDAVDKLVDKTVSQFLGGYLKLITRLGNLRKIFSQFLGGYLLNASSFLGLLSISSLNSLADTWGGSGG